MALLNYSVPYLGIPPTNFYQPPSPQITPPLPPQAPYSYPHPHKPFVNEDYNYHHQGRSSTPATPTGFTTANPQKPSGNADINKDDYRDSDYDYGSEEVQPPVTPIQGPIYIKNGSIPVVPLYSYPVLNNGTFVQIPILWTALSVALGLELRGEYIRGVPCIVQNFQLFCPRAGNTYPKDRIEHFIDENKALMKRMYGEFDMQPTYAPRTKRKRSTKPGVPDLHFDPGDPPRGNGESFFAQLRKPRQSFRNNQSESGKVDACQSKVEIITPYWASNSAGKIRAIVNTQHFEQAIHQETCAQSRTHRCGGDCSCEQKYKWHRLLAYDPDNDCKGIFMDWFLFPSCCVCRCNP